MASNVDRVLKKLSVFMGPEFPTTQAKLESELRRRRDSKAFGKSREQIGIKYVSHTKKWWVHVDPIEEPVWENYLEKYITKYNLPGAIYKLLRFRSIKTYAYFMKYHEKWMPDGEVPIGTVDGGRRKETCNGVRKTRHQWISWAREAEKKYAGRLLKNKERALIAKGWFLAQKAYSTAKYKHDDGNSKLRYERGKKMKAMLKAELENHKFGNWDVMGLQGDRDTFFEFRNIDGQYNKTTMDIRVVDFQEEYLDWRKAGSKGKWEDYYYKTVVKPTFGNPIVNKFYSALYEELISGKLKDVLNENPDTVYDSNTSTQLSFEDRDAYAFGYLNSKQLFGKDNGQMVVGQMIHGQLAQFYAVDYATYLREYSRGTAWKFHGRLWKNKKIISFWEYPSKGQMKKVIKDLERLMGTTIWKNDWKVEVLDKNGKLYKPERNDWDEWDVQGSKVKLVPVPAYGGSNEQKGKLIQHTLPPIKKAEFRQLPLKWKQALGIPSPKRINKGTKSYTRAALRKGIYAENDIIKGKLGQLLLKESPDNFYDTRPGSPTYQKYVECGGRDSMPFGWVGGHLAKGEPAEYHGDLVSRLRDESQYDDNFKQFANVTYGSLKHKGRIWPKHKVISFYKYPTPGELRKLLKDLEKAYSVKTINDKWYMDPPQRAIDPQYADLISHEDWEPNTLIPISSYLKWGKEAKNKIIKAKYGKVSYKNKADTKVYQNFYKRYGLGDSIIKGKLKDIY